MAEDRRHRLVPGGEVTLAPEAARWFESRRGIRKETVEAFGIYTEGRDLVFPYPDKLLKRRYSIEKDNPFGLEKDGRKYVWKDEAGGPAQAGQVPFLPPGFEPGSYMILFEGETDTMAAWQNAPAAMKARIVGLSGLNAWKERYAEELFRPAKRVFVVFDNDDPYSIASKAGDTAWKQIKSSLGKKARRVVLPQGIEDVAEFFQQYDWAAFQSLLKRADEPVRNYPRLDLSKPVPDTEWLVEDLLVAREVTVLAADSGVGKSMLMGSLAVAIARGDKEWLGKKIATHGRVMVVDEEQSRQLAMQRLAAIASQEGGPIHATVPADVRANIDYIWFAGVDLVNDADKLLEDALETEPVLIIIDSQSRVALGVEENDNTEMSKLYRSALVPLARETGAAVVVIHHTASDNAGKPRGATAIKAAADQVLSVIAAEVKGVKTGTLNIFPSKPRRLTAHLKARMVGDIEKDGWLRVESAEEEEPY